MRMNVVKRHSTKTENCIVNLVFKMLKGKQINQCNFINLNYCCNKIARLNDLYRKEMN